MNSMQGLKQNFHGKRKQNSITTLNFQSAPPYFYLGFTYFAPDTCTSPMSY
ncbi:hypothetical protein RchiOBHm_Chr5g0080781 [Rosa chinensis]|uniref:Uncharacterized protein n=1 Tax=Rosa chinensis TaxID=74649 RepID=A0A2P6QMV1_ROSCH|nr:hypothetical protein RchiOBHm_Chr5g0080781 [Rosa chinensis]